MTSYANDTTATPATTTNTSNIGTDSNTSEYQAATTTRTAIADQSSKQMSGNNNSTHYDEYDNNSSDGREKADTTPENIKKITEIISNIEEVGASETLPTPPRSPRLQQQQQQHQLNASGLVGLGAAIDESNAKFYLGKPPPVPSEKATVMTRAYHHHSHNSSSPEEHIHNDKIEAGEENSLTEGNSTTPKQSLSFTIDHFDASENDAAVQAARYKNMMERFQSRHKRGASMSKLDSDGSNMTMSNSTGRCSQRSSFDATSSIADDGSTAVTPTIATDPMATVKLRARERSASRVKDASKRHSWSPRSSGTTTTPTEPSTRASSKTKPSPVQANPPKGASNLLANRTGTQFTPRSTAMQLALRQVDLLCPHPPLGDIKLQEEDAVSDAGTYTLDGDNYTEEQKDLMNIDRNAAAAAAKLRPKQLTVKPIRASNVLEVNYYHEAPQQEQTHSSATSVYLEQLKSRVLRQQNVSQAAPSPPSPRSPTADVGCFTSVTTSGVLAKQRALHTYPKLTRHSHSLSTSQIDSSEYVTNEAKLRHAQALAGGATDRQKAEYRLNVFSSSSNNQQQLHQLPETPTTPTTSSDAALLQSVPTKQDWIQEWARNARARSLAQDVSACSAGRKNQQQASQLMTRSYNCSDTGGESLTDDSLYSQQQRHYAAANKLNRSLAERFRLLGDCDYGSDPALCGLTAGESYKPPKSPSKIPSPLHTLGRARSASRSRPAMEQQQSQMPQSRRTSVKSPAAQCSPQHSLEPAGYRRSPLHRALMTSSINEAQIQLLTSGEYLLKQLQHRRKNSLDDIEQELLPASMCGVSGSLSPLRRSSSFQRALQQQPPRQARPNFQNLYTPPAARHAQQLQLKKSASSNNFDQSYSDYENELQYYINDEDELGTTGPYYSSGDEEDEQQQQQQRDQQHSSPHHIQGAGADPVVPLSNTRLNKALLMRIERSKQRVAGSSTVAGSGAGHYTPAKPNSAPAGKLSAAQAGAGLVACPNTPELPRRGVKSATRTVCGAGPKTRQSMPRETSLSRLAQQVPSSLANAKKQLLQTANASAREQQRVQPKYLDISKYKSAQSNNFLRKNDSKSTLKPSEQMKRSPSASSMGLSRGEGIRASNRSVRSVSSVANSSNTSLGGGATGTRASSAVRRDASVNKQKEVEMVMWKRRSTYDPMKAAAEDRRRKEEARRGQNQNITQRQANDIVDDVPIESVHRPANNLTITGSISYSPRNSMENDAWTLGESSEFGEYDEDLDEDQQEEALYVGDQKSDDVFEAESAQGTV
ncbi:uncharacterized protein LOC108600339 isoform X1 [Drosophila busckii]|uniref:uncharacterized protein LOC108600339 isoform X1 n=1 Tax=Drosophila busckii TaxID=30019 RepID=UPI001432C57D|nr:uncharacterized protein LOC108600339 isoform X1 [Drosophila busckii]XP_017843346.2 uncharacterized protein LOC108600339 isoform X1 [Drosophila busckii]XP_017843347.2 uncharacterized protein LOC108600339 isoform X1 [Drosophila busckii]